MLYLEQGPSSLVISAKRWKDDREPDGTEILELVTRLQREIKASLPLLRLKAERVVNSKHLPWIARSMVEAARFIAPSELTAMSAVAGAVSDQISAYLVSKGFDWAVVNNGGDIAAYSTLNQTLSVGLGPADGKGGADRFLKIKAPFDLGIATSGVGGRSLTLGIADYVTVIAENAAIADAAATFVCNHTCIHTAQVEGAPSELVDPETDIPGHMVTVKVGDLGRKEIESTLQNGLAAATVLKQRGRIMEAVISVKGVKAHTFAPESKIQMEESHANQKDCNRC
jgi:ApbE superfamily uncharacterized protein (UPF0280 family)